ncbi:sugar phosphate nucleotidyltransferase [Spartinivicinus poritis]|uniref:NTP transferase domain-containing protein n=1 Tax=Spartinivicinus poritis TaxID=2994640 RepID=A0ABT5U803_9GAMM|nr:sugar phosphate nucleotidyltransferase [Spartinivicinus sp. A2-2]MDE1462452.1 NTP transferase domain-containing protein [Spartinivicinus sp. A2-2]
MQLVCLMAGSSSRLLPLTETRHKACLNLGDRTMLAHQLDIFTQSGISKTTFVLGHGAVELASALFDGLKHSLFTLIHNPHFSTCNLDWSAWLGLSSVSGPVVYYEGDLLVPPSLLKELHTHPADICIALDSACDHDSRDTLVLGSENKVERLLFVEHGIANSSPEDQALGEFICSVKFSDQARRFVVDALASQPFKGPMQLYRIFEKAFSCFSTAFVDARGRPWYEVDNHQDLDRASILAKEILAS